MIKKSLILTAFLTFPMFANALTPEQEQQVKTEMATLKNNLDTNDMAGVIEQMPPSLLDYFAKKSDVTVEQFRQRTMQTAQEITNEAKFGNFKYDMTQAIEGKTALRDYLFIPYSIDITVENQVIPTTAYAFVLTENNHWYLMRVENTKQLALIKTVYPDLKNLELPELKK